MGLILPVFEQRGTLLRSGVFVLIVQLKLLSSPGREILVRRLHLRDRKGLLEHLVVDQISWVLIIGLTDSLCAVITVSFLWLLLWLTLVVLHALIRLHFLASSLRNAPCLLVVLPQGRVEIGRLTCRVEDTRSLSSIVQGFV